MTVALEQQLMPAHSLYGESREESSNWRLHEYSRWKQRVIASGVDCRRKRSMGCRRSMAAGARMGLTSWSCRHTVVGGVAGGLVLWWR